MWSAKVRGLSRGRCRGGQLITAKEGRKTMWRGKLSGLMICALVLVAVGARGYAAETTVKASAPIKGEGRFYKIGDNQLVFMGYFQGNVEVEGQRGDLQGAGMVCPGLMEVDRTTRTQQGEGRCIIATSGGDSLYASWACSGKPGEGCGGLFTITGGTGKFSKASGLSLFWMRSTVAEAVTTVPEKDVTATFTGQALWEALKYTTP
jgi:hypothetical protein